MSVEKLAQIKTPLRTEIGHDIILKRGGNIGGRGVDFDSSLILD